MKETFSKLKQAGITDKKISELLGMSYYSVLAARRDPNNARMETVNKLKDLAAEADKFVVAAKKIGKR